MKMDKQELRNAMQVALDSLKQKYRDSSEDIVREFIQYYADALNNIEDDILFSNKISKIKYCTRIYVETSPNYNQEFIHKLSLVENLLKIN